MLAGDKVQVGARVDTALLREVRILAAEQGVRVGEMLEALIREALAARKEPKAEK